MKVTCAHYVNGRRMMLVLDRLCLSSEVSILPVRGTLIRGNQSTKCIGEQCEVLAFPAKGQPLLFTTNPKYRDSDKAIIDYSFEESSRDNMHVQLLSLCADKYDTSNNPFTIECAVTGMSVEACRGENEMEFRFKSPQGDGLLCIGRIPVELYRDCKGLKSFRYTVRTDSCEREVSVKRGQLEILREVAHYINKALVLVSTDGSRITRELCVTATGCCECISTKSGSRIVKVPFTKATIDSKCSVYALNSTLDVILHSSSFSAIKE